MMIILKSSCVQGFLIGWDFRSDSYTEFKSAIEVPKQKIVDKTLECFFNNLKLAETLNLDFVLIFQEIKEWKSWLILRPRKQLPDGAIKTCTNQRRYDKVKVSCQQN